MKKFFSVTLCFCLMAIFGPAYSQTVKIASWNIAWLEDQNMTGEIPRSQEDYDTLKLYAEKLDADIIALQEVENEQAAMRVFTPSVYNFYFAQNEGTQKVGCAFKKGLDVRINPDYTPLNVGNVRVGADITLLVNGKAVRILGVHLKSMCHGDPLNTDSKACRKLKKQLPILEEWIDARAEENIPFIVLGDFNRRMEEGEEFWTEIDDGDPVNADLTDIAISDHLESKCWCGKYKKFIDHIVFDKLALEFMIPGSFGQMTYDKGCRPVKTISDHCPIYVSLDI